MEFILNNHYKIVYLYFSVFQLVLTNCFSILSKYFEYFFKKKKILICVKTPKNKFSEPQTTNLNETRREHFWSLGTQKNPV